MVPFPWCGQLVHSPVPDLRYSILYPILYPSIHLPLPLGSFQATVRLVSPALLTVSCSGRSGLRWLVALKLVQGPFLSWLLPLTLIWYWFWLAGVITAWVPVTWATSHGSSSPGRYSA